MKVALIGLGMVAEMHVAALQAAGLTLDCVMGRDAGHAQSFAQKHSAHCAGSVQALIERKPTFAILATPPDARRPYVEALSAAGIPILMEKPVERDLSRALALVEICERAQVPLGIVFQHRMRAAAQMLIKRLPALGAIATVDLRVPWWRDQSYYDAPGRGTFERDGGGVLITQAIHQIDLMLRLCGPVERVMAVTATTRLHQLEAEDFASATLRFTSGAVGQLMASVTHYPGGSESLTLNGTKGSAVLTADHLSLHLHGQAPETIGQSGGSGGGADPMAFSHAWHQGVIEDFAGSLAADRPPAIPARAALPAHALIDAIQEAGRTGTEIRVADV